MIRARDAAIVVMVVACSAVTTPAWAQSSSQPSGPARVTPAVVEPKATAALERMRVYLRALRTFQVQSAVTSEEVLADGQKVQFASAVNMLAQRPNRLLVEVTSERLDRRFFYDGRTFTLWAPRTNYYATVAAPPTINELLDVLDDRYDIEMPLADLVRWGGARSGEGAITAAVDIGPSVVDGTTCEHYVFRQAGLDWQIWMQSGEYPLPLKLVLTTTTDEARPQYTATYTWNLAPSFNTAAFTFVPPADARRIVVAEVGAADRRKPKP